jgi:hypothetical protein
MAYRMTGCNLTMRFASFSKEFNIAVLVVNQVMADPGANAMFGPVVKPVGTVRFAHLLWRRLLILL